MLRYKDWLSRTQERRKEIGCSAWSWSMHLQKPRGVV